MILNSLNPGKSWAGRIHRIEGVPSWIFVTFGILIIFLIFWVVIQHQKDKQAGKKFDEQAFLKEFLGFKKTKKPPHS
jgi:hypothetical protein